MALKSPANLAAAGDEEAKALGICVDAGDERSWMEVTGGFLP